MNMLNPQKKKIFVSGYGLTDAILQNAFTKFGMIYDDATIITSFIPSFIHSFIHYSYIQLLAHSFAQLLFH